MSNNNIVSILHNDYIKRYKTQITIFIVIIIFVIASIFAYKWFIQPTVENLNEDLSNDSKRTGESQLYFFHADWCPHCKAAKPHVDEIKSIYDASSSGKRVNDYAIYFEYVDCSDDKNAVVIEKMDKYNVEGFPTIKLKYDGKVADMDAKPDKETIELFLNTMLK